MRLPWSRRPAVVECLIRAPEVSGVRHGDRVVLMDARRDAFYSLDGVAGRVWELLETPTDAAGLSTALAAEFDAPIETIRADVHRLLDELTRDGLLVAGR